MIQALLLDWSNLGPSDAQGPGALLLQSGTSPVPALAKKQTAHPSFPREGALFVPEGGAGSQTPSERCDVDG